MKVKITKNNNVSTQGRGSTIGWYLNDKEIKLACKTEEEVQSLIDEIEVSLSTNADIYHISMNNSTRDILKIMSLLFYDLGQEYLYNRIYALTMGKGDFTKEEFMQLILCFNNKHAIWNLHQDKDIAEFMSGFDEQLKMAQEVIFDIQGHLERKEPFTDITEKLAPGKIIRYCYHDYHDLFVIYFKHYCKQYTLAFKVVHMHSVLRDIFGRDNSVSQGAKTGQIRDVELIYEELHVIANKEYEYQCTFFPSMNKKRLTMDRDSWTMYFLRGVSLKGREMDFSRILCSTLRYEIKLFFKENVLKFRTEFEGINSNINLVTESLNFITDSCSDIRYFADMDITQAIAIENFLEYDCLSYKNENLQISTVSSIISIFRCVCVIR